MTDTKPIGAAPKSPATRSFSDKILDAHERGAPAEWLMRKYGLTRGEYEDLTGDTVEPDRDANPVTGY